MKPLFIVLAVCSSFFAKAGNEPVKVSSVVTKSFGQTFAKAEAVSWSITGDLYSVCFQVAGQQATAYYHPDGRLAVVARNISPLQLPVVLLAKIKKDYAKQWVSDLVEASDENGIHYYITLEDGVQKQILKSDGANRWYSFRKYEK